MSEELKPCPCCGSKPIINISNFIPYQITCENPNCQLSGRISGSMDKAIKAWNARHIPEGYKVLPIEPTQAMIDATGGLYYNSQTPPEEIYKAMLEAAE